MMDSPSATPLAPAMQITDSSTGSVRNDEFNKASRQSMLVYEREGRTQHEAVHGDQIERP